MPRDPCARRARTERKPARPDRARPLLRLLEPPTRAPWPARPRPRPRSTPRSRRRRPRGSVPDVRVRGHPRRPVPPRWPRAGRRPARLRADRARARRLPPATRSSSARVIGEATEVSPPPPRGIYVLYPGERPEASAPGAAALRARLAPLPTSHALVRTCPLEHTRADVVGRFGAEHGQALRARARTSRAATARAGPSRSWRACARPCSSATTPRTTRGR
jgi:hypothetical protein